MQPALYHDTLQDALSEVVTALGGAKKVDALPWPEKGAHAGMNFLARDAGYQDQVAVEPEDERARLQREFIEAQKAMLQMARRMERAGLLRELGKFLICFADGEGL